MFESLTPAAVRDLRQPATRAEMMVVFHLAWTMAMRRLEPALWGLNQRGVEGVQGTEIDHHGLEACQDL